MKPNASQYNPDPDYLRGLVERSGLSQRAAAEQIGIGDRLLRYYLKGQREHTYPVQFALECLARYPAKPKE